MYTLRSLDSDSVHTLEWRVSVAVQEHVDFHVRLAAAAVITHAHRAVLLLSGRRDCAVTRQQRPAG
jgi:hypothetical protein